MKISFDNKKSGQKFTYWHFEINEIKNILFEIVANILWWVKNQIQYSMCEEQLSYLIYRNKFLNNL